MKIGISDPLQNATRDCLESWLLQTLSATSPSPYQQCLLGTDIQKYFLIYVNILITAHHASPGPKNLKYSCLQH